MSSLVPKRGWQAGSQGRGQAKVHLEGLPPTPHPLPCRPGLKCSCWVRRGTYGLQALFHALIRCLSPYPTQYLPEPTPRHEEGSSPPKKLCLEPRASPCSRKPLVINYAAAPLCRCLPARWEVCSQSFVSGFAPILGSVQR